MLEFFNWEMISALATVFIAVITFFANQNLHRMSKYANRQNDRKIVEDIYETFMKSFSIVNKNNGFLDDELIPLLRRAENIANLYGFHHIELHVKKIRLLCGDAWVIYFNNKNEDGTKTENYSKEEMLKFYELRKQIKIHFRDIKCFHNQLRVDNDLQP